VRVGFGYDLHPLISGRPLILGGIQIPFDKGLNGHSDADVLCHAIADALLGAAALGDIGEHYPDTDISYKNISSLSLLESVEGKLLESGYKIVNVDSTIVAEAPTLLPYRQEMIQKIASALRLSQSHISIKATTNEGFGSVGRLEAIAAFAVVSVEKTP
jgi:2-C-methyl-D-erythritol 2,4-cyclodiphosphate synthase